MFIGEYFWIFISEIASPYVLGYIVVVYALCCFAKAHYRTAVLIITTSAAGLLSVIFLKSFTERSRPADALIQLTDSSFPSAHATFATIFFLLLAYVTWKHYHHHVYKGAVAFGLIMIVLVGMSRLALGVHWASDVFAGYFIGLTVFYIFLSLFDKDAARHLFGLRKPQKRKYTRRNVRKTTTRRKKAVAVAS